MQESTVEYYRSFTFWLRKSMWLGLTFMALWLVWQFIFRSFPDIEDSVFFRNGFLRLIGVIVFAWVGWFFGRRFWYNWQKDAVIERLFTPQIDVEPAEPANPTISTWEQEPVMAAPSPTLWDEKDSEVHVETETLEVDTPAISTPPPFAVDDLKEVDGIGPAIEEILHKADIRSFSDLARQKVEDLEKILTEAGENYRFQDPTDWPVQAQELVNKQWSDLGS